MLEKLYEQRKALAAEIRKFADKNAGDGLTPEDRANFDKLNSDYDTLRDKITVAERAAKVEAETVEQITSIVQGSPRGVERVEGKPTEEHRSAAFRAWAKVQFGEVPTDKELDACKRVGLDPRQSHYEVPFVPSATRRAILDEARNTHPNRRYQVISRALSAVDASTGAYTISPGSLAAALEMNMLFYGNVEAESTVINSSSGEPLYLPMMDDTTNKGVQLGESTSIGNSVDPSFTAMVLNAYKFSSRAVLGPTELFQDSASNLESVIGEALGERLGRILNERFTTGTGAGTAKGITLCSTLGVTAASQTAITADEIIRLTGGSGSIDVAYRSQGAKFMCHDNILHAFRLLKDGNGNYLWGDGLRAGAPDTLCGYPVVVNNDMQSSIATGTITLLFGLFRKYHVRNVGGIRIRRFDERYGDLDQVGFIAFRRADGNLKDPGTAPVKHLLQA